MAIRDKLAQRAQPYLEPGERIQSVFLAQTGPSPYWSLLSVWIVVIAGGYSTIVVTDRAMLVLRNGRFLTARPKGVRFRAARGAWLGQPSGLWGQFVVNGVNFWVHKRFHKDVVAADQALQAMGPGAVAPQYPVGYQQAGPQQIPPQQPPSGQEMWPGQHQ